MKKLADKLRQVTKEPFAYQQGFAVALQRAMVGIPRSLKSGRAVYPREALLSAVKSLRDSTNESGDDRQRGFLDGFDWLLAELNRRPGDKTNVDNLRSNMEKKIKLIVSTWGKE